MVELESWIGTDRSKDPKASAWEWWFGPVIALTDRLETSYFLVFDQEVLDDMNRATPFRLATFNVQFSYLVADPGTWPIDVRLSTEYRQAVASTAHSEVWLSAFIGRNFDSFNLLLNLGGYLEFEDDEIEPYITYGLGTSYDVGKGLRIGAEVFGETEPGDHIKEETTLYLGPSVAYGKGRNWSAFSFGWGLSQGSMEYRSRLIIGVML
jgi:hypothetical protein